MENEKRPKSSPKAFKSLAQVLLAQWSKNALKNEEFNDKIWKEAVGDRVAEHTSIEKVLRGKLYVWVENSMWMNELTFLKDKIKININKAFSKHGITVEEINFKLGKIRKNSEKSIHVPPPGK